MTFWYPGMQFRDQAEDWKEQSDAGILVSYHFEFKSCRERMNVHFLESLTTQALLKVVI